MQSDQKITPITVSYGDGQGPEIMEHVLTILQQAGARIAINSIDIGENFYKREHYSGIPDSAWKTITRHPIIFMAPSQKPKGDEYHEIVQTLCRSLELHTIAAPLSHLPHTPFLIGRNEDAFQQNSSYRLQTHALEEVRIFTDKQTQNLVNFALSTARIFNYDDIHTVTYHPAALSTHRLKEIAEHLLSAHEQINYYEHHGSLSQFLAQGHDPAILISQETGLANSLSMMQDVQRRGIGFLGEHYLLFKPAAHHASFEGQLHAAILMLLYLGQADIANIIHHAWLEVMEAHTTTSLAYADYTSFILEQLNTPQKHDIFYPKASLPIVDLPTTSSNVENKAENKQLIGVEITIDTAGDYDTTHELAKEIEHICSNTSLTLQRIATRGYAIWPSNEPYHFDANDYVTLRFLSNKNPKQTTPAAILEFLGLLQANDIHFTASRQLFIYDEHIGFSV